jgi:peptidoglycan/LPS O-acetylase OafA/YrhL
VFTFGLVRSARGGGAPVKAAFDPGVAWRRRLRGRPAPCPPVGGTPIGENWARLGAAGVDLFFVISGFIMATIAKPSAGRFLFDRFWRIFPLWLVAVTPWLIALRPGPSIIAASLTLWPVYHQFTMPALDVGWTLSFELLFYVAMALGMRTRAAVPLTLFGVALAAGALTHAPIFDYVGNPMIFEFLFGVGIAKLPRREHWGGRCCLQVRWALRCLRLAFTSTRAQSMPASLSSASSHGGFPPRSPSMAHYASSLGSEVAGSPRSCCSATPHIRFTFSIA